MCEGFAVAMRCRRQKDGRLARVALPLATAIRTDSDTSPSVRTDSATPPKCPTAAHGVLAMRYAGGQTLGKGDQLYELKG